VADFPTAIGIIRPSRYPYLFEDGRGLYLKL